MSKPLVLILGAGANVGAAVAHRFSQDGYQVAISARRIANGISPEGYITIQADLSEKTAVPQIFEKVKSAAGIPSVVIYNGKVLRCYAEVALILSILSGNFHASTPQRPAFFFPGSPGSRYLG